MRKHVLNQFQQSKTMKGKKTKYRPNIFELNHKLYTYIRSILMHYLTYCSNIKYISLRLLFSLDIFLKIILTR